ncbi:MAG TPA: TolC family protein [Coleofasciculaceae cyanobacterium]
MPTFRHFVTVGVGVAIAITLVEPSAAKELPSLLDSGHKLAGRKNQAPPIEPTQEQFTDLSQPLQLTELPVQPTQDNEQVAVITEHVAPKQEGNLGKGDGKLAQQAQLHSESSSPNAQLPVPDEFADRATIEPNNLSKIVLKLGNTAKSSRFTSSDRIESPLEADGISVAQSSQPNQRTQPPESLIPSPNPLRFPTTSEEVQIQGVQPLTLEQALELARRNNTTLEEARITLERARSVLQEALAGEFPSVTAGADFSRTDSAQGELSSRANPLFAGDTLQSTFNLLLQASYDLYTGGRRPAQIRRAEEQIRLQQLQVESVGEQLRLDTTRTYYDLQQADAQVDISRASVAEAAQNLRDTQLLEQAGLETRFAVLQAQVRLAETEQELTRAFSQQRIARRELAQLLNLPLAAEVSAADPIAVAGEWNLSLEQTIVLALKNRAELIQQLVQRNISEQDRQIALAAIRPQVSLSANYNILGILNDNEGPADGFSLGTSLRWNFFDGGAARARAEQARRTGEIAETNFTEQRNQIRLQVEQAFFELISNAQNIQTASFSVQQAEESLRLARLRFQAGVGTQTDVINQQAALTRARLNRLTAILDYNRALAALQRATSNLPDGNLFTLP